MPPFDTDKWISWWTFTSAREYELFTWWGDCDPPSLFMKLKCYILLSLPSNRKITSPSSSFCRWTHMVFAVHRYWRHHFFHSSHSQREIHESYLCLPQIFVAYSLPQIFAAYEVCLSHLSVLYLSHIKMPQTTEAYSHTANIYGIHEYDSCISLWE